MISSTQMVKNYADEHRGFDFCEYIFDVYFVISG